MPDKESLEVSGFNRECTTNFLESYSEQLRSFT